MKNMKTWAWITLFMGIIVFISKSIIYDENFIIHSLFPRSSKYIFNYIGVYLGVSGIILYIGKLSIVPNRQMIGAIIIGYLSYWLQFYIFPIYAPTGSLLTIILWPVGIISLFYFIQRLFYIKNIGDKNSYQPILERYFVRNYPPLSIIVLVMGITTEYALRITMMVFPQTIDVDIYKIDLAFSNFAGWVYSNFQESTIPLWQTVVFVSYDLLAILLFFSVAPVLRERRSTQLNIWRVLIIPFILAFILYSFTTVGGPPIFGTDFPNKMNVVAELNKGLISVSPSPRNGMPSMHFTGAMLIVLVMSCLTRKIYFYAALFFAAITFIATMALGEHYLLDLIVAAPYCIALGTALLNPPGWQFWRRRSWWACALLFAAWELALHFDTTRFFLIDHLNVVRLFSLASVAAAVWGFSAFLRVVWKLPAPTEAEWRASLEAEYRPAASGHVSTRWVYGLFVCSGFAGLLYEVVFAKHLGVIFGGTALAAYTVMATYMGGMALGAWLGGIIAERVRTPLKWYALFEAAIGVYALATPALFQLIEQVYVTLATDVRPDAPMLTFWRVALGALVLGIPTLLMGTTLPLMFKFLRGYLSNRGRIISRLYTANIIGAAFGALAGAYLVLPTFGLLSSTRLAAMLSLMIALYALDRLKALPTTENNAATAPVAIQATESDEEEESGYATLPSQDAGQRRRLGLAALLLVTVGGVVSLALEIVNMHMLAIIAGNSVYAFGLMLATFLLGLGLGSACYGKLRHLLTDPAVATIAQLGIFFSIVISAFQWDGLSNYFASFGFMQQYHHFGFGARELIRGSVCAIIMLPPAFFIGLGYPATMALATTWLKSRGEAAGLGIASLCNTLGNIAGVLLAGFVFLNWLGSNRLLFGLAILSLLLALYMMWAGRVAWALLFKQHHGRQRIAAAITALAIAVALWSYPAQWNLTAIATGANVYFVPSGRGDVIDAQESIQGGLTTVNRLNETNEAGEKRSVLTLLTNGKFQGNNAGEIAAQKAFAHVPLLHQPKRDQVLVIGYGTGNSAHALHETGFAQMDIAELSPDIVTLADRHFGDINGEVSQQANVKIYYTDGRNYLLTQNKRYDLISMELTSIWFAGAANLYNREFYQLAKARLNDDGVLQQWVQLHHMQPMDLLYILNTLHQEFRYVWLYVVGGQGVLVASDSVDAMRLYHLDGSVVSDAQPLSAEEQALQDGMLLEPKDVDYLVQKLRVPQFFVSTDNNLYLEYSTPKGNALPNEVFTSNIEMLENLHNERIEREKQHDI